jgi:hypothetical protein
MKRCAFFLVVYACATCCFASSRLHHSPFGFTVDIPEGWTAVTGDELKKTVGGMGEASDLSPDTDPAVMEEVKERIKAGDVEFYLRKRGAVASFVDNINVSKGSGKIPQTSAQVKSECDAAPAELGRLFGRAVMVFECGLREVAGRRAVYMDFEGMAKGLRSLSYRIQWAEDLILTFTATCRTETLNEVKREFNEMLATLR